MNHLALPETTYIQYTVWNIVCIAPAACCATKKSTYAAQYNKYQGADDDEVVPFYLPAGCCIGSCSQRFSKLITSITSFIEDPTKTAPTSFLSNPTNIDKYTNN